MTQSRRSLLRHLVTGSGGLFIAGTAGCLSRTTDDENPEPGDITVPNPVIQSVDTPTPRIEHSNHEEHSEGPDEYTTELMNTGIDGEVLVELYWIGDEAEDEGGEESDEVSEDEMELAESKQVHMDLEEFRSVRFEAEQPDEYDGFWFLVAPVTVLVDVVNNGEAGDVLVELYNKESVSQDATISLEGGELKTVGFEREDATTQAEFDVGVKSLDN